MWERDRDKCIEYLTLITLTNHSPRSNTLGPPTSPSTRHSTGGAHVLMDGRRAAETERRRDE